MFCEFNHILSSVFWCFSGVPPECDYMLWVTRGRTTSTFYSSLTTKNGFEPQDSINTTNALGTRSLRACDWRGLTRATRNSRYLSSCSSTADGRTRLQRSILDQWGWCVTVWDDSRNARGPGLIHTCAKHFIKKYVLDLLNLSRKVRLTNCTYIEQEHDRTVGRSNVDDRTENEMYAHSFLRSVMASVKYSYCAYSLFVVRESWYYHQNKSMRHTRVRTTEQWTTSY